MNETRRGFLGMLAKVPGVMAAVWAFVKGPVSLEDALEAGIRGGTQKAFEQLHEDGVRVIRWRSVENDPPRLAEPFEYRSILIGFPTFGQFFRTSAILRRHYRRDELVLDYGEQKNIELNVATHWAEMPAPPSNFGSGSSGPSDEEIPQRQLAMMETDCVCEPGYPTPRLPK